MNLWHKSGEEIQIEKVKYYTNQAKVKYYTNS